MSKKYKVAAALVVGLGLVTALLFYLRTLPVPVLEPKGPIGHEQRSLMIFAAILSLFVIIPVYVLTFLIARRYRAGHKTSRHMPEWEKHNGIEFVMWAIPLAIILVLSVVTWRTSHSLDPFKPIASDKKPLVVQVVALQWKWLFIYPGQKIATVNYFQMPKDTPVTFELTSDAPMNSFWIPQLGGQIYAMAGMTTQLHLMATQLGRYNGSSANISGSGFADMRFVAEAVTPDAFNAWVASVQQSQDKLDLATYNTLAKASTHVDKTQYVLAEEDLEHTIVMKYMSPQPSTSGSSQEEQMAEGAGQMH